jgi:uncharacterized protein HemY
MVQIPNELKERNMETNTKSGVQAMVVAAVVALTLTWSLSEAFVKSTAVARWVSAAEVAAHVVAGDARTSGGQSSTAALLQ